MSDGIDHTHDQSLQSWVASAAAHPDFPIQNLPLGVFSPLAGAPRGGIAIGDEILDLRALYEAELLDEEAQAACATCTGPTLNAFLALGEAPRRALRDAVSALLQEGSDERPQLLHPAADCLMYMPAHVGDYTDFYAGIHHATAVGRQLRPDAPLAAELQMGADRLPRPGQLDHRVRRGPPAQRPAQAGPRGGPELRAEPQPRLRAGAGRSGSDRATRWGPRCRSRTRTGISPAIAC